MTPLATMKEALEAATKGPWKAVITETGGITSMPFKGEVIAEEANRLVVWNGKWTTPEDAHLIANAPTWIAELIAEVERQRLALEEIWKFGTSTPREMSEIDYLRHVQGSMRFIAKRALDEVRPS